MVESDPATVELLYKLAAEAERGVLATADWMTERGREPPADTF